MACIVSTAGFSLEGIEAEPGSADFIEIAAQRALSNSEQGYVVISDATQGARFSGELGEADHNTGDYQGVQTFEMKAGDRFGVMLASNHSIEEVANGAIENVRFSMATDNPDDDLYFGQIADVTGDGNTFAFEDVTLKQSDKDYNDIIFQVRGATAEAALMDEVVAEGRDWRTEDMGQALIEYAQAYTNNIEYIAEQFTAAQIYQPLVGVIDTGVDADAIDLETDAILTGSDFVAGDDNSLLAAGEGDDHGTQVADLINDVNDDAPLWVGRAVGSGRWAESLVEFVDAAVDSDQPNAVVNLSFDLTQIDADGNVMTRDEFTPMEMAALEYARQNDVLVVAASGNQGALMSALGQASGQFDNIITVGAAEQIDPDASNWQGYDRADYSSYGNGLDIMANGGTEANPIGNGYGSSMAAAQVTGAISQVWAANPDLSYQQVITIIKQTATDLGDVNPDLSTGAELLNIAAAVHLAKAIKSEEYEKELQYVPLSWSGEGEFIPMERAANPEPNGISLAGFLEIFNNPVSERFKDFLQHIFDTFHKDKDHSSRPPLPPESHTEGDIDGDGKADIFGFREDNTWVSLSNGDGTFAQAAPAFSGNGFPNGDFNAYHGWHSFNNQPRTLADVNGDGKADIVGFREDNTWVSLSNGDGTFAQAAPAFSGNGFPNGDFNAYHGWHSFNNQPRTLADVNGDGKADIVGFREDNTWVSLSNGDGTFAQAAPAFSGNGFPNGDFNAYHGWHSFNDQPLSVGTIPGGGVAADLIIGEITTPESGVQGTRITTTATVVNQGLVDAPASNIKYWLSDSPSWEDQRIVAYLGEGYVNPLSTGASETVEFSFDYNPDWGTGQKYIIYHSDAYNHVRNEMIEFNNMGTKSIRIIEANQPNPNYIYKSSDYLNALYQDNLANSLGRNSHDDAHKTGRAIDSDDSAPNGADTDNRVYALLGGEVLEAYNGKEIKDWRYNGTVAIYNQQLNKTITYSHLAEGSIDESLKGKVIAAGSRIGIEGNTGSSDGAHTHVEVYEGRININMSSARYPSLGGRLHLPSVFQEAVRQGFVKLFE